MPSSLYITYKCVMVFETAIYSSSLHNWRKISFSVGTVPTQNIKSFFQQQIDLSIV